MYHTEATVKTIFVTLAAAAWSLNVRWSYSIKRLFSWPPPSTSQVGINKEANKLLCLANLGDYMARTRNAGHI